MKNTPIAALLGTMLCIPAIAADSYTIDPRHTHPTYEIDHFGWSTQRGRFDNVNGTVVMDRAAKTGSVQVTIDVTSVSSGVAKLDEHLKSEDFFYAARYPTMSFKSNKMIFRGDTPVAVEGEFTLRGVTKPLRLTIDRFHCAPNPFAKKEACGADVVATIKRSDFGVDAYLPGLSDQVRLLINVEAFKD